MVLLGNIIWLICGGLVSGLAHIVAGIGLCLTIIGIPFGYQEIKIGIATFAPFGTVLVEYEDANSPLMLVLNIIWVVMFGWVFALQHLKLVPLALLPFGRDLVRGPIYRRDEWVDPQYAHSAVRMR